MGIWRWILSKFERRPIGYGDPPLMWRYRVFRCRWFNVYVHEINRSDADKCLHDHPWGFVSLILKGGYHEEITQFEAGIRTQEALRESAGIKTVKVWRRPGSLLFRPAGFAHRVEIPEGCKAWTLVVVGPKCRDWGFYEADGWHQFQEGRTPICEP